MPYDNEGNYFDDDGREPNPGDGNGAGNWNGQRPGGGGGGGTDQNTRDDGTTPNNNQQQGWDPNAPIDLNGQDPNTGPQPGGDNNGGGPDGRNPGQWPPQEPGGYQNPGFGFAPGLLGPGGQVDPVAGPEYYNTPATATGYNATTREVGANELASNQLTGLLAGDSKYMQQARNEGLALSGGLGGTAAARASMASAIKAGMPIAIADAQAYRDAAAQNMDALNQFGLANIQRQTQLELGTMDANTRLQQTNMQVQSQINIAKMQDLTNRDIAMLDSATQLKVTEMNGKIQAALAEQQFGYNRYLEELGYGFDSALENQRAANELERTAVAGEYNLADTALRGDYTLAQQELINQQDNRSNYVNSYMVSYEGALNRLTALNGMEMDNEARARAETAIWEGFYAQVDLLKALYPGMDDLDLPDGSEGG